MEYKEAIKLANKIKRVLESIPSDVSVIITSSTVEVCDKKELDEYEDELGHLDNCPAIAWVNIGGLGRIIGFEGKI